MADADVEETGVEEAPKPRNKTIFINHVDMWKTGYIAKVYNLGITFNSI